MQVNEEKLNAFVDRAFVDLSAATGGVMLIIGHKLGLFRAMMGAGNSVSRFFSLPPW